MLAAACGCRGARKAAPEPPASSALTPARAPAQAPVAETSYPLIGHLRRAELSHRGLLFDFGSSALGGVVGPWSLAPDGALVDAEHDGATWAKVYGHDVQIRFIQEEASNLFFALRVRGGTARTVTVVLDGKPVGVLRLIRGQIRTLSTHLTANPVTAGAHVVGLRFAGAGRPQSEPFAEVDWLRTGGSESEEATYAAPTAHEVVVDAALGGVPHLCLGLRAPASAAFPLMVVKGARLVAAVGFEGSGQGDADITVTHDGDPPATLGTVHVAGGNHASFTPMDVSLDAFVGKLVMLRLRARQSTPGGRLLFGDPTVLVPSPPESPWPKTRIAVVLVLAGVDKQRLSSSNYPALAELERTSTSFTMHRAPTTVSAGVIATLLTGLPPRAHAVEDPGARLPELTTIAVAARDGSIQTAMFTGSPSTFGAFGFARGWDKYAAYSPVEGAPAVAPISESAQWIASHMALPDARALVVIHARGGHPPWDVTPTDAAKLPPLDYSGPMEPRRSAEVIARARGKHTRFRLSENDRTRMWAIYDQAMVGQDRAIGGLVDTLKRRGVWDQTLMVVTSDQGLLAESKAPFADAEELGEPALSLPLWVHFPDGAFGGQKVAAPTEVVDIARSVLGAMHLAVPDEFQGYDLLATASGYVPPAGRACWATLGARYTTRVGNLVLSGLPGRPPLLCNLAADPTCEADRSDKAPRAAWALFRATYNAEEAAQKLRKRPREPATVDPETAAALQVWGE